jgi:hypothetical protein
MAGRQLIRHFWGGKLVPIWTILDITPGLWNRLVSETEFLKRQRRARRFSVPVP